MELEAARLPPEQKPYTDLQRHILVDMHIPDWDPRFLSRFDPEAFVQFCEGSGANGVVVFGNSHAGQCFWPTRSGKMHEALAGRDLVGDLVDLAHSSGLAACAYYSVIFNNWAYNSYPQWRIVGAGTNPRFGAGSRYGLCCPNHPSYLKLMLDQTEELAERYPFDAFFFDMVFWPDVCVCESCRQRYLLEEGAKIPASVDWFTSEWCAFQASRERWLVDCFRQLRARVKALRDIPVFLNSAAMTHGWCNGVGDDLLTLNDIVAGDFQETDKFASFAAFARLTPTVMQYMGNISGYCGSVSQLKSIEEQKAEAFSATTFGGQFMAIDAVTPDGSLNRAAFEQLSDVFKAMEPYESYLGGTPLADIGVYWSLEGNVDFRDNGIGLDRITFDFEQPGPHLRAVRGATTALAARHLPVGVITRADLSRLLAFPVIVLPNLLRMDTREVEAMRDYVEKGGRLYASGYTSLVTVDGVRHRDFLLADVFGTHFEQEEDATVIYIRPEVAEVEKWISPVRYVPHGEPSALYSAAARPVTALRVRASSASQVLATTTLPYGGGRGTRDDNAWASIHTSPPWQDTSRPSIIRSRFGAGEVVYSAYDVEREGRLTSPAGALFVALIESLLPRSATFAADGHPDLWMTGYHEPERRQIRLCFLNRPTVFPGRSIPRITFELSAPDGATFTGLYRVPTGEPVRFSVRGRGRIQADLHDINSFEMLVGRYEGA